MNKNRMSRGNSKIKDSGGRRVLIFSLPAIKTCLNCKECSRDCYALKSERQYKATREYRQQNWDLARYEPEQLTELLTAQINRELKNCAKKGQTLAIRIHESGDFFSQEYINLWVNIIKQYPQVNFWGYTKVLGLLDFSEMDKLPNANIINSYIDGKKLNFGTKEYIDDLLAKDPECFLCPTCENKEIKCNRDCDYCMTGKKPVFYAH